MTGNTAAAPPALIPATTGRVTICGVVRHFDGRPADNCTILLSRRDEGGSYREKSQVSTGPDGRYSFENVEFGQVYLEAQFAEITRSRGLELAESGKTEVVDFDLPEPWDLVLSVEDESGQPIPGSRVRIDGLIVRAVGPDGLAHIRVERGRQYISADAPMHEDYGWMSGSVVVSPPASHASITLKKLGVVSGTLLDPDGHPVAEGRVCLDLDEERFDGACTDSNGHFRLLAEFGRPHTLRTENAPDEPRVRDAGRGRGSLIGRLCDVHAGDLDLTLRTRWMSWNRKVSVRVLSPEGQLLRGMWPALYPETSGITDIGEEEEGEDGVVLFSKLPETSFSLWVSVDDNDASRADWLVPRMDHVIPAGQEIVMQFRKGSWVQGQVFRPDGSPASNAGVWAGETHIGRDGYSRTDADGKFRVLVDPLRPSPFRLQAAVKEDGPWESGALEQVEPGQEGLRIQMMQKDP